MAWFRVDDQSTFHKKVIKAGNAAFGAWVRMGCYCNAQLTDGRVSHEVALLIASQKELDRMCSSGLAHKVDDGYEIHDYLQYQPSRAEVLEKREQTSERVKRFRNAKRNSVTPSITNSVGTASPSSLRTGRDLDLVSEGSDAPAREAAEPPPASTLDRSWFRRRWGEVTGVLTPDAGGLNQTVELIEAYAREAGKPNVSAVAEAALDAFLEEIGSWANARSATPGLFIRKWDEIQGRMAKKAPRTPDWVTKLSEASERERLNYRPRFVPDEVS